MLSNERQLMRTEVLPADAAAIRRGSEMLATGEVVAFPTDTVYGVGAAALDVAAVGKLFATKVRPLGKPIALLIAPEQDLDIVAREVPPMARALAARFWPGGLTIIVWRSLVIPAIVAGDGPTIGLRVPDHPVALALIRALGQPVAATSANLFGQASPLAAEDVCCQLAGRIGLILDGGRCPGGVESTVIDLTTPEPLIRRLGAVSQEAIEEALDARVRLPA